MVTGYIPLPRPADLVYAPMDLAIVISEGLVARGHDVDFYAPEGTELNVPVKSLGLRPLDINRRQFMAFLGARNETIHKLHYLWDQYLASEMFKVAQAGGYDVLYFHHPDKALSLAKFCQDIPVVYTIHDPLNKENLEIYDMFSSPNQHFVSISDAQRKPAPNLPYIGTVYNGVDTKQFAFNEKPDDYILVTGRIVPQKGIAEAIKVAQLTGERLKIIGQVYPDSEKYFNEQIKPHLNDKIEYLGYKERDQMAPYYQNAKCMLMPIQWEEPFGMVMIEAMSCGTPVIGFPRGSVPEVIADGESGFVVNSIEEMADAVRKIDTIDRAACRKRVMEKFSNEKMVEGYEAVFKQAIANVKNKN